MVLTEAFASGTPVVASDIAGYRDVVRDGRDGMLVPAGDAVSSARRCASLAADPRARASGWPRPPASAPSASPGRAWPREVDARSTRRRWRCPCPRTRMARARRALGLAPTEPGPRVAAGAAAVARADRARGAAAPQGRARRPARGSVIAGAVAGVGLTALALQRLGIESIGRALLAATPVWVLVGLRADVRLDAGARRGLARDPARRAARRCACAAATPRAATMIGVLMSATLPARLGEPSRALIVARRAGAHARPLPGRARHARLADAPQHPRAVRARRGDVRHRRRLQAAARTRS